jgi:prepilin-type N-terminal cleavage/methylation domain-containing protein
MIKKSSGFTLIELMVAIGILIILSTIAAPSFKSTLSDSQNISDLQALSSDLQFAKIAAHRQGRKIQVCPSDTSIANPVCHSSTDWTSGWLVKDTETNKNLRVGIPLGAGNLTGLYEGGNTTPDAAGIIIFETRGFATIASTTETYGYIASDSNSVCIYITGHISIIKGTSC